MTRIELTDEERATLEAIKRAFALAIAIDEALATESAREIER